MSVRQGTAAQPATVDTMLQDAAASLHEPLGEGNHFATTCADNPLKRNVVVSIKASLNELCLQKSKANWTPTADALRSMFQQRKFTSLDGQTSVTGDLKSVVLHDLSLDHAKSSFPIAVGCRITACDDCTFTSTGEAFSTVVLPNSETSVSKTLQADDVSLGAFASPRFASSFAAEPSQPDCLLCHSLRI